MEFSVNLDAAAVEAWVSKAVQSLRPDTPGPFQESLSRALDLMFQWNTERFETFSAGGGDWPDLAPSTKLRRAYKSGWRRGRHPRGEATAKDMAAEMTFPILRDTDDLFDSMSATSANHEKIFSENSATSQSNIPYGHWHETGGSTPGHPPQRQFVVMPPEEILAQCGEIIAKGAAEALAN